MSKITNALKLAAVIAGGLTATLAHAEPYSLAAGCRLTSMVAGQGKCMMSATFVDLGTSIVKRGQIKVDGLLAGQLANDSLNPLVFSMEGEMQVTCGASHTVTGYIMPQGAGVYSQAGTTATLVCPKAP